MKWETFEKNILNECKKYRKSSKYTADYISYAKNLFDKQLPLIVSPKHLSLLIGLDYQYVCNMAYASEKFYRYFTIEKANGKVRDIYEPLPDLKFVQHWILEKILEKNPVSKYAKAFVKKRTLKSNARFHRAQRVVVSLDIKDFFPSIKIYDVFFIFSEMGYSTKVSWFLANLCCHNNKLPQGAPTSPYLSNIRLKNMDSIIVSYTLDNKRDKLIRYTRYADDMTFSGDFNPHVLISSIKKIVFEDGFTLNPLKTRVAYQHARQEVTGIVVNSHMQVSKEQRKRIRQQVYYISKFGLDSHLEHLGETRTNYLRHLLGQINFALFVNPNDIELKGYFQTIKDILKSSMDDY